jgi:outer membrane protein assembly factor BamB
MKAIIFATFVLALITLAPAASLTISVGGADTEANYDWPMLQHDLARSGYSLSNGPNTNQTLWSYPVDTAYISPAVADGKVFIGSVSGRIYCLDAKYGNLTWTFSTNQTDQYSIPSIVNNKVFVAVGSVVYCLNASQGSLLWNYTTGKGVIGSCPAVIDDKLYVGSVDSNMYCLEVATGSLI